MAFAELLQKFTQAVEAGDGTALGNCFTEQGISHDTFYGEFKGRDAIKHMLEDKFYGDAKEFIWKMIDPVSDGKHGYARWEYFGYTSTMERSPNKRVIIDGMSFFRLNNGLIDYYGEVFNSGLLFNQMGMPGSAMDKVFSKWTSKLTQRPEMSRMLNR